MIKDKVLIEIHVPAASREFDVYLSEYSKLWVMRNLVAKSLSKLSEGVFSSSDNSVFCDAKSGVILNENLTVKELGLKNGSKLLLI